MPSDGTVERESGIGREWAVSFDSGMDVIEKRFALSVLVPTIPLNQIFKSSLFANERRGVWRGSDKGVVVDALHSQLQRNK